MHLSRIIPAIVLTIIFCGVSFAADAEQSEKRRRMLP